MMPGNGVQEPIGVQRLSNRHRADALVAIAALGDTATVEVGAGALVHFAHWLGQPEWLFDGTSLAGRVGEVPPRLSLADDLLVTANILDRAGHQRLFEHMMSRQRPALGRLSVLAYSHAPTLGEAIPVILRVIEISAPQLRPSMHIEGNRVHLAVRPGVPLGELMTIYGTLFIVPLYLLLQDLVLERIASAEIEFSARPDEPDCATAALFNCPTRYGRATDSISFPVEWLGLANPSNDTQLWLFAKEQIASFGNAQSQSARVGRIRNLVARTLDSEARVPRLKQIALAEGTSPRNIIRQLVASNTSYHAVVDDERRNRVVQLMADPTKDLQTIAAALGFPDRSSFGRKFRQWFGDSPARFRERQEP